MLFHTTFVSSSFYPVLIYTESFANVLKTQSFDDQNFDPLHAGLKDYLINVQDISIVQGGKFVNTDEHALCEKAVQIEIFQKLIVKQSWKLG